MADTPIIIRREDGDDHDAHHGGAWKIAYADFMTAMMAFFLMLWLLGAAEEEQLRGLADYFTPNLSEAGGRGQGVLAGQVVAEDGIFSGADGDGLGQRSPVAVSGRDVTDEAPAEDVAPAPRPAAASAAKADKAKARAGPDPAAPARAERLREAIEAAVADVPDLRPHLHLRAVPEGLYVQIVDDEERSMFDVGSARLRDRARALVGRVGAALAEGDAPIVLTGHTDALPFRGDAAYTNWELSTDRAHATRRELVRMGVDPARVRRITGLAATRPLVAERPEAPENRRIGILIRARDAAEAPASP